MKVVKVHSWNNEKRAENEASVRRTWKIFLKMRKYLLNWNKMRNKIDQDSVRNIMNSKKQKIVRITKWMITYSIPHTTTRPRDWKCGLTRLTLEQDGRTDEKQSLIYLVKSCAAVTATQRGLSHNWVDLLGELPDRNGQRCVEDKTQNRYGLFLSTIKVNNFIISNRK